MDLATHELLGGCEVLKVLVIGKVRVQHVQILLGSCTIVGKASNIASNSLS